jgi:hypothetical protein
VNQISNGWMVFLLTFAYTGGLVTGLFLGPRRRK